MGSGSITGDTTTKQEGTQSLKVDGSSLLTNLIVMSEAFSVDFSDVENLQVWFKLDELVGSLLYVYIDVRDESNKDKKWYLDPIPEIGADWKNWKLDWANPNKEEDEGFDETKLKYIFLEIEVSISISSCVFHCDYARGTKTSSFERLSSKGYA